MSDRAFFPKVGDRVRISAAGPVFVVVEVDPETETASIIPEEVVATVSLDTIDAVEDKAPQSGRTILMRKPRRLGSHSDNQS